jgi:hypothetical protein
MYLGDNQSIVTAACFFVNLGDMAEDRKKPPLVGRGTKKKFVQNKIGKKHRFMGVREHCPRQSMNSPTSGPRGRNEGLRFGLRSLGHNAEYFP